ncbi:hypothetical protein BO223_01940 [Faecalibaculum rodentium]|uniref:Uncharacterized protein n=1 Tax=Faecalibaculum rodentium TaxID=1702221 RepID=A0A1Q9YMN9_9FIRM|nr:hypothetical protein BO223_01940 [Faecalibaculum rodentium]
MCNYNSQQEIPAEKFSASAAAGSLSVASCHFFQGCALHETTGFLTWSNFCSKETSACFRMSGYRGLE